MQSHGAEITIRLLERQGVRVLAGIPGGASLPLYDALRGSRIRHVLARHEQGAGFIAQGLARTTGRAAVCLGTSGPGATNLLTSAPTRSRRSTPMGSPSRSPSTTSRCATPASCSRWCRSPSRSRNRAGPVRC
jgi:acetolactate synthase-1/2/3 large subunit